MSLSYRGDYGYHQTYEGEKKNFTFGFSSGKDKYQFIPSSVLNKGFTIKDYAYFFPQVLRSDFDQTVSQYGSSLSLDQIQNIKGYDKFVEDLQKYGYDDKDGIFVSQKFFDDYMLGSAKPAKGPWLQRFNTTQAYDSGGGGNAYYGGIQGVGELNGQRVYILNASGPKNVQAWIQPSTQFETGTELRNQWYDPGKPGKSWAKPLRAIGYGLIGLGTLGLAGIGPLAAGSGAALGTGLTPGALGVTGLTPGAAGVTGLVAPSGFALAPTIGAAGLGATLGSSGSESGISLLEGTSFPQTGLNVPPIDSSQVALIPEGTALGGQGLQVPTLPSIGAMGGGQGLAVGVPGGTVVEAGFIPTGATPSLGDPGSFINDPNVLGRPVIPTEAAGISVTDALRLANQARGLLGAGQNPAAQQGMPRQAAQRGAVDYAGLLGLLQQQARTPGVSSLTAPAQLQQRYQPTLLPNIMSLLG